MSLPHHETMLEHLRDALASAVFTLDGFAYEYGAIRGLEGADIASKRECLTHSIVRQRAVCRDLYEVIRRYDTHFHNVRFMKNGDVLMIPNLGSNDPRQDAVRKS